MSLALSLYRTITGLAEPLAAGVLNGRARRGKEDPSRLNERLGRPSVARPAGPLAWFHGASVGEGLSLLPLIEHLGRERPDLGLLVTSGTTTAAELLARRLPPGAIHQYVPVDAPGAAKGFLDWWRPDLAVFVESELWPNLLMAARGSGTRLALVSARIGESSAKGWLKVPGAARALFSGFDLILPQDDEAAGRLKALGARDDGRLNLKFSGDPLPVDEAALARARKTLGKRPVVLAASTHEEEDEITEAFAVALRHRPDALLIVAPRHPARGSEVTARLEQAFTVARRELGEKPDKATQVYVADTLGELGLWFRLARGAYIGGSLIAGIGGHNPLEAARLDCPACSGPFVDNWRSIYDALERADAVNIADDAQRLGEFWARALTDDPLIAAQAGRARIVAEDGAHALDAAVEQLKSLLP